MDNVIINRNGVFIIEVKNYTGVLSVSENDGEWVQTKISQAGNLYYNQVKIPFRR